LNQHRGQLKESEGLIIQLQKELTTKESDIEKLKQKIKNDKDLAESKNKSVGEAEKHLKTSKMVLDEITKQRKVYQTSIEKLLSEIHKTEKN
jgi:chromosome segregation ATPase